MSVKRNPFDVADKPNPTLLPEEHNLQVYQIELELQNEELRQSQVELAAANELYQELYNTTPVGLVVLSESGLIQEINLTCAAMLGVGRSMFAQKALSHFIVREDQDAYYLFRQQLAASTLTLSIKLRMEHSDGKPRWVQMTGTVIRAAKGKMVLRCIIKDITRRRELEESLQMKNQAFKAALSANFIANREGVLTEVNAMFLQLWGFSCAEDVLGKASIDCFQDPDEAASILASLNEMGCWEGEFTAKRRDGSTYLAHGLANDLSDTNGKLTGYQLAVMDVTESKQAQVALAALSATLELRVTERTQELQDSEARFRQLADSAFEGIAVVDNGILLDANQRFAEMHGYALAEMIGQPVSQFVAPRSRRSVAKGFKDTKAGSADVFCLRKDGTVFPVETHMRLGPWLGHSVRIITLRDLTEPRAVAARLHALSAELIRSQRLALVSEVSAGIIHQLSQPLSSLAMNLSVLLKLKALELQQCGAMEILDEIDADATRMRDIVTHLRAIANPEQVKRTSCNLNELAIKVLPLLNGIADYTHIHLKLDLCQPLSAINADAIQLSQVIFNLIRNAIEASADTPLEQRVVLITTRQHAESGVELCVRDHGCGLPADAYERMFLPFFTTKSEGMGVGLRLCQTIIHAHEGQIEGFNNADGLGATFRIQLPLGPPPLTA